MNAERHALPRREAGSRDDVGLPVVRHTRTGPVFIVGFGRSGTTILTQLVKKYLGVSFGTESQFIVRYRTRLSAYGDLSQASNRQRLLADISRERFFERTHRNFGFILDHARVLRELDPPTYASMLAGIFGQLAEHDGKSRWGDKTPEYLEHLPVLHDLFPAAQFIHVVRDGRDVALSSFLTHFGGKNAYKCGVDWSRAISAASRFTEAAGRDVVHELRYEDLMAEPIATFSALIPFLGIDDAQGQVRRAVEEHLTAELRQDNVHKWPRSMTAHQVALFESVAGAQLSRYRYERRYPSATPPTGLARAYWLCDHKVRQYMRGDYWQDNWYKLGIRARLWRSRF